MIALALLIMPRPGAPLPQRCGRGAAAPQTQGWSHSASCTSEGAWARRWAMAAKARMPTCSAAQQPSREQVDAPCLAGGRVGTL